MKLIRSINWKMMSGPFFFCLTAYLLNGTFPLPAAFAVGTAVWMAVWWIFRPISIYVTAFVPIVVNSLFNLIPAQHVISQYFSEIAVLLLGADLICLTWTTTGLDQRISVKTLCFIGPSMKSQIFVWFGASTFLSIFLPNVVVAAIFCPIAAAMLHFVGEEDLTKSKLAVPIFLAIGWGSGIGGFGSPIGSSANLVAVTYLENMIGHEFMYYDWVIRFVPLLLMVFVVNLIFLWMLPVRNRDLPGTREYFRDMYAKFGPVRKSEKIGFLIFALATVCAFIRPLFADYLPAMKPAYVFLFFGMLMFFLRDENGEVMLTAKYAESHVMWGMIFLFASGLALGRLLIETEAISCLADIIVGLDLTPGIMVMAICCLFAVGMSEISSNTASASISIPIVAAITNALGVNPVPYILAIIVAFNCAYILPISTRAIPIGYGLNAAVQIKYGTVLSLLTVACVIVVCTLAMDYYPLFSEL